MKLYAISDLHLSYKVNRLALEALPVYAEDWLIMAGDLGETLSLYHYALPLLTRKFARVLWVPGNHDLWTLPTFSAGNPEYVRGVEKYEALVAICRQYGVVTPEDPYPVWNGEDGPVILAPLFLLYDYSFRPDEIALEDALAWAAETQVQCVDEALLHPDPYASRIDWCHARYLATEQRLQEEVADQPVILINHFPLRRDLVRLRRIPRFSIWCGTRKTEDWYTRFSTVAAISGHLHVRATDYQKGVRFEEVSLGYPHQWDQRHGVADYLREILPAPESPLYSAGPFWHW